MIWELSRVQVHVFTCPERETKFSSLVISLLLKIRSALNNIQFWRYYKRQGHITHIPGYGSSPLRSATTAPRTHKYPWLLEGNTDLNVIDTFPEGHLPPYHFHHNFKYNKMVHAPLETLDCAKVLTLFLGCPRSVDLYKGRESCPLQAVSGYAALQS